MHLELFISNLIKFHTKISACNNFSANSFSFFNSAMSTITSESEFHSGRFIHSASSTRYTDLDFSLLPQTFDGVDSLPPRFSKSVHFNLTIANKNHFRRCLYVSIFVVVAVPVLVLLLHFLLHKNQEHEDHNKDLTLALKQALLFFDAQKSGVLPKDFKVGFQGNSSLNDGKDGEIAADLVGGYYDSGNNIKFSFSTAYTVTLLSWTVIEYEQKYAEIGELDHVKDIIKWGSDYLLKLFIPPNSTSVSATLYSQVGGSDGNQENDVSCWQRPEDMSYIRPISVCDETAADLAGELVAAMAAASLALADNKKHSQELVEAAELLFNLAIRQHDSHKYTDSEPCGERAKDFYASYSYIDELVWGGTWLFFATGNASFLKYATDNFAAAEEEELPSERGIFYWNNKLSANAILMTRIRYFMDLGYPYEEALATNRTDLLMCYYVSSNHNLHVTNGGLALLKPDAGAPLQYAATASFLSKLYSDYLQLLRRTSGSCGNDTFSSEKLQDFAASQVYYILGDNPMKMSYMVGYGTYYPTNVHHRAASIPWDGIPHTCAEGDAYLASTNKNPNNLIGAMMGGPDRNDIFLDEREKAAFTEPTIASNAGLVAALVALHDPPPTTSAASDGSHLGIDKIGIFKNVMLQQP